MKLIVLGKAEFDVDNEASEKELKIFLMRQGFSEIANYHRENKDITGEFFDICTANHYGRKKQFKMPTIDCSYYGDWIKRQGQGHAQLLELNANELNLLSQRNGYQRWAAKEN